LVVIISENPLKNTLNLTISNSNLKGLGDFLYKLDDNLNANSSFVFGYAIYDTETNEYINVDEKYFSIVARQNFNIYQPDGKISKIRNPIETVPCMNIIKNIPELSSAMPYYFNKFNCPINNYEVGGHYLSSTYFKYLAIKFIKCTKNCESDQKIDEYIRNKLIILMNIEISFDPTLFINPISITYNSYSYSLINDITKKVDIFLNREIVKSYDSIIPQFIFLNNLPTIYSYLKIENIKEYPSSYSSNEFLNINIRASYNWILIQRIYRDLFKVCGLICGLYKFFHLMFYLLTTRISKFYLNLEICNQMFNLIDSKKNEIIKNNPFIEESINRDNLYGEISVLKIEKLSHKNLNEIVLWEAFKFEKNGVIDFSFWEIFVYNFGYVFPNSKKKLAIVEYAKANYQKYKDIKVLYQFTIGFKLFLKFALGSNSEAKIYIISKLLNKSKFHSKNINNFKIIKNILSFVKHKNETEKDIEAREILRHTLEKYRGINSLTYIDKKILELLPVDKRIIEEFVRIQDC